MQEITMTVSTSAQFDWTCKHSWQKSAKNTFWCLLGCSVGDYSTILFFQFYAPHVSMGIVMLTAVLMALLTSVGLEAAILSKQMPLKKAFHVALGMSFISMIMMELAANVTSVLLAGGNRLMLTWWSLIPSMLIGFLSAWPYNYYKIKKHGKTCHG
jgi:hypothetical protein